ncbi:hypothetical protein PVK06_026155 [Gossypium arboreum]|uniref:Secreted protein n=1 Tax=Gossypium arboreum TaxID=29729 RepID=A0ABR0NWW6_GOSAR|nr:hypothetical protein PVK06_026155 [Gossypium arboreum]
MWYLTGTLYVVVRVPLYIGEAGLSRSVWAQDGNHHVAVRNLVSSHLHRRPWGRFPPLTHVPSNSVPTVDFDPRL